MEESYISDEEMEEKRFCFTQNANFLFTDKQRTNLIIR